MALGKIVLAVSLTVQFCFCSIMFMFIGKAHTENDLRKKPNPQLGVYVFIRICLT